ncbi:MAG: hypothetical protein KJ949_02225 [Nanoarchaeota archaeon]|nr:hypothetical protein [Nanoarchaeota archaeon]
MVKWTGWVAAVGGLLAIIAQWTGGAEMVLLWIGGLAAIIFGLWGALAGK